MNDDQIDFWNGEVGERWASETTAIDQAFAAVIPPLLGSLSARSGERIVDVGCGAGSLARACRDVVGEGGSVLGVDVSEPLLGAARARFGGLPSLRFERADASTYVFDGRADAVVSRFGVMFFADPVTSFRNLRSALRPGGRLVVAVWRPLDENPWMNVPLAVARGLLPLPSEPPADPRAPGPYSLADRGYFGEILAKAGFNQVAAVPHDFAVVLGDSPEDAARMLLRIGPTARTVASADPAAQNAVREALISKLGEHAQAGPLGTAAGQVSMTGAVWVVSAVN